MKPRTKFQQSVVAASKHLPPLTPAQIEWGYKNCIEHIGRRTPKGLITCTECGHTWQSENGELTDNLLGCECPHCHTPLKVEVGGGIRTMEDIAFYLDRGVDRVILGSVALKNPELVRQAVDAYGDKIAVGIDAKHGMVATEGWTEDSQMDFIDLAKAMEKMGVATIIYTDIGRDGTLSGPDVQGLDRLNKAVGCNVIASGGVTTITDILVMKDKKMYGTICGKCIYKKTLDLREAVGICK